MSVDVNSDDGMWFVVLSFACLSISKHTWKQQTMTIYRLTDAVIVVAESEKNDKDDVIDTEAQKTAASIVYDGTNKMEEKQDSLQEEEAATTLITEDETKTAPREETKDNEDNLDVNESICNDGLNDRTSLEIAVNSEKNNTTDETNVTNNVGLDSNQTCEIVSNEVVAVGGDEDEKEEKAVAEVDPKLPSDTIVHTEMKQTRKLIYNCHLFFFFICFIVYLSHDLTCLFFK